VAILCFIFFFFQAEDGIRDGHVTGVQTCALPIYPLIGRQAGSFTVTPQAFARELAPARTFGFTSEVAALQAKGLIKGASSASAIVLDERGLANGGELRWPDEFVRHKAADILGDL